EASDSLSSDFDSAAAFGELGINSFQVLKIIKRLEADFGTLPKSLLFENFNVGDLANYFVTKHTPTVSVKFAAKINGNGNGNGNGSRTSALERRPETVVAAVEPVKPKAMKGRNGPVSEAKPVRI